MCLSYFLFCFSDFQPDPFIKIYFGWFFILLVSMCVLLNLSYTYSELHQRKDSIKKKRNIIAKRDKSNYGDSGSNNLEWLSNKQFKRKVLTGKIKLNLNQ